MPRTHPILYIQTSHVENFQSYTYKLHILNTFQSLYIHTNLHIKNTSNLIHTNFTCRTLPILDIQTSHTESTLYMQTSCREHFHSYTYNLPIQNTSNLIYTNFMHTESLPILYIETSHKEHFQSYTCKLHIPRTPPILYIQTSHAQNTSNLIHANFT